LVALDKLIPLERLWSTGWINSLRLALVRGAEQEPWSWEINLPTIAPRPFGRDSLSQTVAVGRFLIVRVYVSLFGNAKPRGKSTARSIRSMHLPGWPVTR